jgi:hypothetical protein
MIIRAISLYQPWASLIALGAKKFETRSWYTAYRGPLAIHAGKNPNYLALVYDTPEFMNAFDGRPPESLPLGAFVCTCTLADCLQAETVPPDAFGDYAPGRWAWSLKDVLILPEPIHARGQQGFWTCGNLDDGNNLILDPAPPTP